MTTGDGSRRISRRRFLANTGTGLAFAGLAPAISAPFVSRAWADTKTLKIIQWSHFVPAYDNWIDAFAKDWGKKNGINVTSITSRIWSCRRGPRPRSRPRPGTTCSRFSGSGGPHLYSKSLLDLGPLVGEMEAKYGKVQPIGRQIAYDAESDTWPAFPDYYINFPGLYRKDLWDEIGMVPDTWEDILKGGAKLKAKGNPVGIGLGHSVDPNLAGAASCGPTAPPRSTRAARRSRSAPKRPSRR